MAGTDGEVAGATFRVALQSISVARKDAIVEDDFKTWAHTILLIRGRASNVFWYSDEGEGNLSKTSVGHIVCRARCGPFMSAHGHSLIQCRLRMGMKPPTTFHASLENLR